MRTAYHIIHVAQDGIPRIFGTIFIKVEDVPVSVMTQRCLEAIAKADSSLEIERLKTKIIGTAELDFTGISADHLGHYVEWAQNGTRIPRIVVIL